MRSPQEDKNQINLSKKNKSAEDKQHLLFTLHSYRNLNGRDQNAAKNICAAGASTVKLIESVRTCKMYTYDYIERSNQCHP